MKDYLSVWPGEKAIEKKWKREKGLNAAGKMWLTPRMLRIANYLEAAWEEQKTNPASR